MPDVENQSPSQSFIKATPPPLQNFLPIPSCSKQSIPPKNNNIKTATSNSIIYSATTGPTYSSKNPHLKINKLPNQPPPKNDPQVKHVHPLDHPLPPLKKMARPPLRRRNPPRPPHPHHRPPRPIKHQIQPNRNLLPRNRHLLRPRLRQNPHLGRQPRVRGLGRPIRQPHRARRFP